MIKIDKGVPIPPKPGMPGAPKKYPFWDMEVGDSFFVECKPEESRAKEKSLYACGWRVFGAGALATRSVEGGVRVWRIK